LVVYLVFDESIFTIEQYYDLPWEVYDGKGY
jgi:hypothetical protein